MSIGAWAQAPAPDSSALRFEVASLKSTPAGGRGGMIRPSPGGERYLATGISLQLLMTVAYRVKADQITGGPAWTLTDRWDMNAKAERPSTVEEMHTMLKNLLADRFQLRFHLETKELSVYALTVDKAGLKLTPHEAQNAGEPWID
ncbi:MAG TPA: TIGR03435 family protein, partial [Candidatus Solibacter sp.]